jgi:hypothetical protein
VTPADADLRARFIAELHAAGRPCLAATVATCCHSARDVRLVAGLRAWAYVLPLLSAALRADLGLL